MSVKGDQLIFKCSKCNKNHNKDFNKDLINRFASTYKFCDGDIDKFILLLRKRVYPYEYMDSWGRYDETLLPNKKDFYSSLNIEGVTDIDYRHEYHNLYVQSDTILLADVFENFRNKCIEIYELDPGHFLSALD